MTKSKRIAAVLATVVALGSIGAVIAHASPGRRAVARQVSRTTTSDTAQQTGEGEAVHDPDTAQVGDQNTPDSRTGSEPEGADPEGASDGPGGHEDPAGNVNHEFQGNE